MLPFICLSAAAGLVQFGRPLVMYGVLGAIFATNYLPLVMQRFPRDIAFEMLAKYGEQNLRLFTSLVPADDATALVFLPPELTTSSGRERYVLVNAQDIWPAQQQFEVVSPPAGARLWTTKHPRQSPRMQYHGYSREVRSFLRTTDFSIHLIDTRSF
jgi:hypothetical protein